MQFLVRLYLLSLGLQKVYLVTLLFLNTQIFDLKLVLIHILKKKSLMLNLYFCVGFIIVHEMSENAIFDFFFVSTKEV
jgi:hypothetical protein